MSKVKKDYTAKELTEGKTELYADQITKTASEEESQFKKDCERAISVEESSRRHQDFIRNLPWLI